MASCLNCGIEIPEGNRFCDSLCKHGYSQKAWSELKKEEKKNA